MLPFLKSSQRIIKMTNHEKREKEEKHCEGDQVVAPPCTVTYPDPDRQYNINTV